MQIKGMLFLDGWARKVGLVAILASVIGWLIFVICFGSFNNGDNFYNDIRDNEQVRLEMFDGAEIPLKRIPQFSGETERIIDEDFPEDRKDPDFFTFYFFAVAHPIAVIFTAAHLVLHGVPVLGFILSLTAHFLLTLSLICGAGAFWADGNRLFSEDNNLRNVYGSVALPADWRSDPYWGAWLVGEWVGILLTGICVIIYYTISPFFTNTGKLFSKSNESYEMQASGNKLAL